MVFPCLVLSQFCKTNIELKLEREGLNKYGEPLECVNYSGLCNYQDSAKTVLTSEKKLVDISGKALIPGDIAPGLSVIHGGSAIINGEMRRIVSGAKRRNPDGTVNYTEVMLE